MRIYHYHPKTKVFVKETEARQDPKEKEKFLLPGYATFISPQHKAGFQSVWENTAWGYKKIISPQPSEFHKLENDEWVLDTETKQAAEDLEAEMKEKEDTENLIHSKMRELAIAELKKEGKLASNYK